MVRIGILGIRLGEGRGVREYLAVARQESAVRPRFERALTVSVAATHAIPIPSHLSTHPPFPSYPILGPWRKRAGSGSREN